MSPGGYRVVSESNFLSLQVNKKGFKLLEVITWKKLETTDLEECKPQRITS